MLYVNILVKSESEICNDSLRQAVNNLATVLDVEPWGQGVVPGGAGLRPLWAQTAFIA